MSVSLHEEGCSCADDVAAHTWMREHTASTTHSRFVDGHSARCGIGPASWSAFPDAWKALTSYVYVVLCADCGRAFHTSAG